MAREENKKDEVIAVCYLLHDKDENNKIWLSWEFIQIWYKGKRKVFPLEHVRKLTFNHRRLMLPLVLGGITATFSIVSIIKAYYNPWLVLTLLVAGLLGLYIGYKGTYALTIEEDKHFTDFFIPSVSPNLKAFASFANTFAWKGNPEGRFLYLQCNETELEAARETGYLSQQHQKIPLLTEEMRKANLTTENTRLIVIDPLKISNKIKWESSKDSRSIEPFLYGYVNLSEVEKVI